MIGWIFFCRIILKETESRRGSWEVEKMVGVYVQSCRVIFEEFFLDFFKKERFIRFDFLVPEWTLVCFSKKCVWVFFGLFVGWFRPFVDWLVLTISGRDLVL